MKFLLLVSLNVCVFQSRIVKLAAEDVALVISELELTKEVAEDLLRKHGGSSEAALRAYAAGK